MGNGQGRQAAGATTEPTIAELTGEIAALRAQVAALTAGRGTPPAHSGQSPVLRTVTVGAMPGQVVVDAATARVFVNNYQDQSVSVLSAGSGWPVPPADRTPLESHRGAARDLTRQALPS